MATRAPEYPPPLAVERALDVIFPPICVGCRRVGRWICRHCWTQVAWLQTDCCAKCKAITIGPSCIRCSGAARSLDGLIAVAEFAGVAREAVHALKFHGHHAIKGMMGRLMAQMAAHVSTELVVPIPLHPARRRERGYDQAALLAGSVAHTLGRPCCTGLKRVRRTQQQTALDVTARRANLTGAFISTRAWHGETILLVDDVFTTGSTMQAAAEALHAAGAGSIVGLAFAKAE